MKWLLLLLICPLFATDAARIVYSKSFPGSTPAFVEIDIDGAGKLGIERVPPIMVWKVKESVLRNGKAGISFFELVLQREPLLVRPDLVVQLSV